MNRPKNKISVTLYDLVLKILKEKDQKSKISISNRLIVANNCWNESTN